MGVKYGAVGYKQTLKIPKPTPEMIRIVPNFPVLFPDQIVLLARQDLTIDAVLQNKVSRDGEWAVQ